MINEYCKKYRVNKSITQKQIGDVKNISSFENGRSTNIKHFESYIKLAIELNDLDNFLNGLKRFYND